MPMNFRDVEIRKSILTEKLEDCKSEKAIMKDTYNSLKERLGLLEDLKLFFEALQREKRQFAKEHISKIVTEALQYVYGTALEFKILLEYKRNNLQLSFVIKDNNIEGDLADTFGLGISDVVSVILRVVISELIGQKGTLILDEPLKSLDSERSTRCAEFLSSLSVKLNRQFIIATHKGEFYDDYGKNKVFQIKKTGKTSTVTCITK